MNQSADAKLEKAVNHLVQDYMLMASTLLLLPVSTSRDTLTACTDGTCIQFNPDFTMSRSQHDIDFVMMHENAHVFLLHPFRRNGREMSRWNQACDYEVNHLLHSSGFTLPNDALFDMSWYELTAEEIYPLIHDGNRKKCMAGNDLQDAGTSNGKQPSQAEVEAIKQKIVTSLMQSKLMSEKAGKLPGGAKKLIEKVVSSKVSWPEELQEFIRENAKEDYDWLKRDQLITTGYVPMLSSPALPPIYFVIDTSGSTVASVEQMTSEITALLHEYDTEIRVIYCDHMVQGVENFTRDDLPLKLNVQGGGGTNFIPPFQHIEALGEHDITCLIYLTDMCCHQFPSEPDYPVVWVKVPRSSDRKPPFGRVIQMD